MTKVLTYIGITVLVVIAIVLGYTIIIQQPTKQQSTPQVSINNSTTQQNLPSAEEQALVKAVPGPNSTLEERIEYSKKLEKFEKVTDTVEITNCWPSPFIARVREDTDLKIKNNDNVEQLIFIGQNQLNVPAKGTVTAKPGKGDGITNLACNGGGSGLLHTIQT